VILSTDRIQLAQSMDSRDIPRGLDPNFCFRLRSDRAKRLLLDEAFDRTSREGSHGNLEIPNPAAKSKATVE